MASGFTVCSHFSLLILSPSFLLFSLSLFFSVLSGPSHSFPSLALSLALSLAPSLTLFFFVFFSLSLSLSLGLSLSLSLSLGLSLSLVLLSCAPMIPSRSSPSVLLSLLVLVAFFVTSFLFVVTRVCPWDSHLSLFLTFLCTLPLLCLRMLIMVSFRLLISLLWTLSRLHFSFSLFSDTLPTHPSLPVAAFFCFCCLSFLILLCWPALLFLFSSLYYPPSLFFFTTMLLTSISST